MLVYLIRVAFAAMVTATFVQYASAYLDPARPEASPAVPWLLFGAGLALSAGVIAIDWAAPRKSLHAIAGIFFGLAVGYLISYGLSLVLTQFGDVFAALQAPGLLPTAKLVMGLIICYLCISFILQTKDDIRFVIPYVEFAKQIKGQRPLILDTSVIIDGRIADIIETRIIDQRLVVPRFVLNELQAVADSSDKLKRNRGRRGLDVLNKLQTSPHVDIDIMEGGLTKSEMAEPVDQKLLSLAKHLNGRVVTNDYNLNKVAQVRGVEVININDLANALKPVVLPGEHLEVRILRPGQEMGQGVGYLEDGTMVVVEGGRDRIGDTVAIAVTSSLQTSAGRMVFGRVDEAASPPAMALRSAPRGEAAARTSDSAGS